jgi:hypothetical protein
MGGHYGTVQYLDTFVKIAQAQIVVQHARFLLVFLLNNYGGGSVYQESKLRIDVYG